LIRIGHVKLIKYEDSILFLNQSYYKLLDEQKWTELLPILHHVRPLNKDIILISMHVNSNHWILGGIFLREKTLVIFDSNRQNNKTMLKKCFTNLTKLAIACFTIAGIHFGDNSNWKLIYSNDCPQQNNSYDCGLCVAHIVYSIINNSEFIQVPSILSRLWIARILKDTMWP